MSLSLRLLTLCGMLVLGACSTTTVRYYTLIPTPSETPRASSGGVSFQLQVMPVRIPLQVDQPSLVVRESDGRLMILDSALWASPPADEFHDALAFELEQRFGVRDLAGLPGTTGKPILTVRTDVRRFDSLPGRHAALDVVWSLGLDEPGKRRSLTCASVITEAAAGDVDSLVLAHQRAIARLTDALADTALRWVADSAAVCP